MAIDWQTRGEGRFAHRYHAITLEQSAALAAPTEVGVHQVEIDGAAETLVHWVKVCFGQDYDVTFDRKWSAL